MAEKEERILIARSTDYTLTDTDKGELFEGKIAPHCANVFTRQEAIERMAKAMCSSDGESCKQCAVKNNKHACKSVLHDELFMQYAQSALNALLEGK